MKLRESIIPRYIIEIMTKVTIEAQGEVEGVYHTEVYYRNKDQGYNRGKLRQSIILWLLFCIVFLDETTILNKYLS